MDATDIHVGKNGWLFLTGGKNSPLAMFEVENPRRERQVDTCLKEVQKRNNFSKLLDIKFSQIIIPEKLSIYRENLDLELPSSPSIGEALVEKLNSSGEVSVPNLFRHFRSSPLKDKLYYKTDSHWAWVGAFQAMQLLLYRLNTPLNAYEYSNLTRRQKDRIRFSGDLSTYVNAPAEISDRARFHRDSTIKYQNALVEYKIKNNLQNSVGLHVGSHIIIENRRPLIDKSLVLFGDSFCRDGLLTFLLCEIFSEVTFV